MSSTKILTGEIIIDEFIFHIIHHGGDEPIFMTKTPLGEYSQFFKERIAEIYDGNNFNFSDSSSFLEMVKELDSKPRKFLSLSKKLATSFHAHQDKRIKAGVMILIQARVKSEKKIILIKYDNEDVITYKAKDGEAVLEKISNTFSKNKEALQKSAVVHFAESDYASVIDRSDRKNVTEFFKGFLGIERTYTKEELTEKVRVAFMNTVMKHKKQLPPTFTSNSSNVFYDYVQEQASFDPELFPQRIFREHFKEEYTNTFAKELNNQKISGEVFKFNKNLKKPAKKKYTTREGVTIQYDSMAEDTVNIQHTGTKTKVVITTSQLTENT